MLGVDHTLAGGVSLRAEVYQRVLSRMRPRYDNLFNVNSGIEEAAPDRIRLVPSQGEARGVELSASNTGRPYTSSSIATTALPDGGLEHAFVFGTPYGERLDAYHRLPARCRACPRCWRKSFDVAPENGGR